jgi:hypothetical protein
MHPDTRRAMQLRLCLLIAFVLAHGSRAGDWPQWRGPEGTGVASGETLPLRWTTNENVRWKLPLPERGNSTPIIWRDRVFITQTAGDRRTLMCFDRKDGKILWQAGPSFGEKEPTHETNPQSSYKQLWCIGRQIAR